VKRDLAGARQHEREDARCNRRRDEPSVHLELLQDELSGDGIHRESSPRGRMTFATKISSRLMRCTSSVAAPASVRRPINSGVNVVVVFVTVWPACIASTMSSVRGRGAYGAIRRSTLRHVSRKRSLSLLSTTGHRSMNVMQSQLRSTSSVLCEEY